MSADAAPNISGKKISLIAVIAVLVYCILIFVPAGTFDYWQAWAYLAVIFIPAMLVIAYFFKKDPEFLERRMRYQEKEKPQQLIQKAAGFIFFIGLLIPGLDHRFGWSNVPVDAVIAADIIVFMGYVLCFLAFKENRYASRTVGIDKGQTVVTTGPYAIIRHPMYLGAIFLWVLTPVALGSYWALPLFLLLPIAMFYRIKNEEGLLLKELPGYREYCRKTRHKLIPYVW